MNFPGNNMGYGQPMANGYGGGTFQNPYAQQQMQNQQMQILRANLDNYIACIDWYLRVGVQQNEFNSNVANRLRNDLVRDAQSQNGPVWQWICQNLSNRQAGREELWSMVDRRRYEISAAYGAVNFNDIDGSQMPVNPYTNQNQFGGYGNRMYNRPRSQYAYDGVDLGDIYNRNRPRQRVDDYSSRPDRNMERQYYQNAQEVRRPQRTQQAPEPEPEPKPEPKPQPEFNQTVTDVSYRIERIPDYEFEEYVGKNIPKTFMTAKAEKLVVIDGGAELDRYTAVDTEMKDVVKDVSEVKANLDAANIKVDKKTVVLATVDTAETVKGDNEALTQAFNHVNDVVAGMDKSDFVKVARTVMREIKACGAEFQGIFEPKICEMFCNIMKIVTNFITKTVISREDEISSFDDIEMYLDHADKGYDVYTDVPKFKAALKAAVAGSMLAIFGIKDNKRTLDANEEDDKKLLLDNKELPIFVDSKPYRFVYGTTLTAEQIAQVNKELKKVFSYKIRKKILLHSIPEFSFLMSEKYHSNLLNTDSLHQTLLTTLVDKALTGSVYMSSITQTKSDNPLFLVAKDYNGILEANKV